MHTAIELGTNRLTAVQAKANGQGPVVVKSGSAALAAVDAEGIRGALARCGVETPRAVLVLQRSQAILRDLELPAGSPDELVSMVRFQVEREMPLPLDQIRYSYVVTAREGAKVRVQVAAAPREVVDPAVAAVEAAGVKVAGAYVSTFGLLSLYRNGAPAALVEVAGGEAEILVVDRGRMEFSRTAPLVEGPDAATVIEEVNRTLLAYRAKAPGKPVGKVVLAGEGAEAEALAGELGKGLGCEVVAVGPGGLDTASAAGVCVGLLQGLAMPDLLNPPVALKRFKFTKVHRMAGLAAGVLLALLVWGQIALGDRRADYERRKTELAPLKQQADRTVHQEQQLKLAQQWQAGTRNTWLPLLAILSRRIDSQYVWIVNSAFEDNGTVRLQGRSRDDKHVTDLVSALEKEGIFKTIKIDKIVPSADRNEYRSDFTIVAQLAGIEEKKKR
jgi:Tfp pilus assembly protein PilN